MTGEAEPPDDVVVALDEEADRQRVGVVDQLGR